jgi:hypothetical protein
MLAGHRPGRWDPRHAQAGACERNRQRHDMEQADGSEHFGHDGDARNGEQDHQEGFERDGCVGNHARSRRARAARYQRDRDQ